MLNKINFQRGSLVKYEFLNEIQTPISYLGVDRSDYYTATGSSAWRINERDKLKEWEIDESGTESLSRLTYQGRVLGYTITVDNNGENAYTVVYGPPRMSPYPLDPISGTINTNEVVEGNIVFALVEGGKIQKINGEIEEFSRQSVELSFNSGLEPGGAALESTYYIFYNIQSSVIEARQITIDSDLPMSSGEGNILLAKLTLDSTGNIKQDEITNELVYEDLRQNAYISSLYNFSTRLINKDVTDVGSFVLQSWERAFIDTRDGSFVVTMPLEAQDGDKIAILDYANNFSVNPLILRPNLNNEIMIHNSVEDWVFNVASSYIELFYVERYKSWFFVDYPLKEDCKYRQGEFISCGGTIFEAIKPAGKCPHGQALPQDTISGISYGTYFYNDVTSECFWNIENAHGIFSDGLDSHFFEGYSTRCGVQKKVLKTGTYGSTNSIPIIKVDDNGNIESIEAITASNISLPDMINVQPSTYGSEQSIPRITVDKKGRITAVQNIALQTTNIPSLPSGTYGGPSKVPVISVDQEGNLASITEISSSVSPSQQSPNTYSKIAVNADTITTRKEASRFLSHVTLGATLEEIDELVILGSKKQWLINQISSSYDNTIYSEWDTTSSALKRKPGWISQVALHLKVPDNYNASNGAYTVFIPGIYYLNSVLLSALIRNNPTQGGIGSRITEQIKAPQKTFLCKLVWILNKLIPVSIPGGGFNSTQEGYEIVNWYSLLARHAFGNYADLLEELSYNVSMSKMLTHLRNQKSDGTGRQPDENFARELMQLFSIGLHALDDGGNYVLDTNGNKISVYTQTDIAEASKVFTGLTRWDQLPERYYDIAYETTMRSGAGLEGIIRSSFLTDNKIIYGSIKPATKIERGKTYRVHALGTTNFLDFGATQNTVGQEFIATKSGTATAGTGQIEEKNVYPLGIVPRLKHYLPWYDNSAKILADLGIVIPSGTDPETNIKLFIKGLVNHPNCAPNICKNLIKLAVTSNPSPEYVARVSSVFRDNGKGVTGDLSAVWIAIFTDIEANLDIFSSPKKGRVIDGFEAFAKMMRTFDASTRYVGNNDVNVHNDLYQLYIDGIKQVPVADGYITHYDLSSVLGTWPYMSPSIFSYYSLDYSLIPANTWNVLLPEMDSLPANTLMSAVNLLSSIITARNPINWRGNPSSPVTTYIPDFSSILGDLTNTDKIIDNLNLLLCKGTLGTQKIQILKSILESMPIANATNLDNRICVALQLIIRSPEYWIH